jgi:pimeloyl-ACP methyl ester carboxylesterase
MRRIAIDMPGHGGSGAVDFTGVDLRRWSGEMVTGLLDELGLESVHVIGHSMGAMFGMWLAVDAPKRVRSVTAIGTPAVAMGNRVDSLRFLARPGLGNFLFSMPKSPGMYRGILVNTIGLPAVEAASADLVRATYLGTRRPGFGKTLSSYLREMFRGFDATPQRYVLRDEELARIETPVLVVWGKDEQGVPSLEEMRQRVALIPNARFELVPGGHEPWLEDLDSTAGPIASLTGKVTPRAGTLA